MERSRLNRTMEYLRVLDLDAGAGVSEIREAYRFQTRTWGPDNGTQYEPRLRAASERRVAEIRRAYEWLQENSDAVSYLAQNVSRQNRPATPVQAGPNQTVSWLLYLGLISVLIVGILWVSSSDPQAWFGPLLALDR